MQPIAVHCLALPCLQTTAPLTYTADRDDRYRCAYAPAITRVVTARFCAHCTAQYDHTPPIKIAPQQRQRCTEPHTIGFRLFFFLIFVLDLLCKDWFRSLARPAPRGCKVGNNDLVALDQRRPLILCVSRQHVYRRCSLEERRRLYTQTRERRSGQQKRVACKAVLQNQCSNGAEPAAGVH